MRRNAFAGFHPLVNFIWFALVLTFTMVFTHPVMLGVSLFCAAAWAIVLSGRKAVRAGLCALLPLMLLTAALNPLFNHEGATILRWLPNGNPLTLEAVWYGLSAAAMLAAAIAWFACFNRVFTTDKLVILFGRLLPAMSLLLSMALRFVPRFAAQAKQVAQARRAAGQAREGHKRLDKVKNGLATLSILVTWALENGIDTADSMRSRGYGLPGRTAFSPCRFERRDAAALGFTAVCGGVVIAEAALGAVSWRYYPTAGGALTGAGTWCAFAAYLALCAMPLYLEGKEAWRWKSLRSAA